MAFQFREVHLFRRGGRDADGVGKEAGFETLGAIEALTLVVEGCGCVSWGV